MRQTMRRLLSTLMVSAAGTADLCVLQATAAQLRCERIEGWVLLFKATEQCTSPVPLCTRGVFLSVSPTWNGADWYFTMLGSAPSVGLTADMVPPSTVSYAGKVRIKTVANGAIETTNTGVFDPVGGAFSQLDQINSGVGGLNGATGFIWLTGTGGDLNAGIRGEVRGNVCISE